MRTFRIIFQTIGVISSIGILATFVLMLFRSPFIGLVGNISLIGFCVTGVCMLVEMVADCNSVKRATAEDENEIYLNE